MKDIARRKAIKLLIDYEERHTFLNLALKEALRSVDQPRDRRFITALVYGVLEKKITLDYFLSSCCNKKLSALSVPVLSVLRMGVYQLFYMNVPASAACNTSVELIKQEGYMFSAGLVNAVLRRCFAEKEQLMQMKKASYSVRYSIAPSLVDLLLEQYGKESFVQMMEQGCGREEGSFLYHNRKKGSKAAFLSALESDGLLTEKTDLPGLYKCKDSFSIEESAAYRNGYFHVVGYHSAMAAMLLPENAEKILDLCASPGGKTFVMAAMTDGQIRAFDLHPHKIKLLNASIKRLGHQNVEAILGDGTVFNPSLAESADFILCDVPCSGLGMMGKKPDIKYKEYDSEALVATQKKILENGSKYLKPGGRLVYSTCTIDRRENEEQIKNFLKENPIFKKDEENFIGGERLFLPGDEGDGFYIAVLRKGYIG